MTSNIKMVLFDLDDTLLPTGTLGPLRHSGGTAAAREALRHMEFPAIGHLVRVVECLAARSHVGIVTSAPRWYVEQLVTQFYRAVPWSVIVTFDDVKRLKPDPEPLVRAAQATDSRGSIVYVGDEMTDLQAATLAGMSFIGVNWFRPDRGPTAWCSQPSELPARLKLMEAAGHVSN